MLLLAAMLAASEPRFPLSTIGEPREWVTSDDYPAEALREQATGISTVELQVGIDGMPSGCAITVSSGSAALDAAACDALMRRARFRPARDRRGQPVASTFTRRVVWVVPTPGKPVDVADEPTRVRHVVDVAIDQDGAVVSCSATVTMEPPHLNQAASIHPCDAFPPGRQVHRPVRRGDRPVGAHLHITNETQVTYDP